MKIYHEKQTENNWVIDYTCSMVLDGFSSHKSQQWGWNLPGDWSGVGMEPGHRVNCPELKQESCTYDWCTSQVGCLALVSKNTLV